MTPQAEQNAFLDGLRAHARPALAAAVFSAALRRQRIRHHAIDVAVPPVGIVGVVDFAVHVRRAPSTKVWCAVIEATRKGIGREFYNATFVVDDWRTWRRHEREERKDVTP